MQVGMRRWVRADALAIAAALALVVGLGVGHADLDTALQGRLLQRSDGATYVYKDGSKIRGAASRPE